MAQQQQQRSASSSAAGKGKGKGKSTAKGKGGTKGGKLLDSDLVNNNNARKQSNEGEGSVEASEKRGASEDFVFKTDVPEFVPKFMTEENKLTTEELADKEKGAVSKDEGRGEDQENEEKA